MLLRIVFAFVAGLVTAISPCVLPVLPIVLAGGASGGRRRPFAIIAGLLTTFFVSILFAAWILDRLGLPKDLLRDISIALLFVVAATLLVPQLGALIEQPLARLARGPSSDLGGGFVLGCALGFVFVPCGGTVLAYITSSAAALDFGITTLAVGLAYTLGVSVVLLAIAIGGRNAAGRLRGHAERLRFALGAVVAIGAFALAFDLDTRLQTSLPDWTNFLQEHTENSAYARTKFERTKNVTDRTAHGDPRGTSGLPDYGLAPDFVGISHWLNTGDRPLSLAGLRGKVVLVDFWTYSCVNCLRTLPYLEAWDRTYRSKGLVIVGVHTPEFAFEHEVSNVQGATRRLGVRYAVAVDNDYGTWNAYGNRYWPAEYLIDASGHVREAKFGEGGYSETEDAIRRLLAERDTSLPSAVEMADHTPDYPLTPESYLGLARLDRYAGSPLKPNVMAHYRLPFVLPRDQLAYGGDWKVEDERIVAGTGARLALRFHARKVFLVLGGRGSVDVSLNGRSLRRVRVTTDRLYTLLDGQRVADGRLDLRFTPGLSAYAFTFG
jgi:cytochrome c biogenesis protein CcdA/thiol-disulfide isomerase/thioredoxin